MPRSLAHFYEKFSYPLACAGIFLLPLKLSLSYICLIPLIGLWLLVRGRSFIDLLKRHRTVMSPFLFFLLALILASAFGIDPLGSLLAIPSLIFFSLLMPVFLDIADNRKTAPKLILLLILAQGLAALHSVIESAFPNLVGRWFLGRVSESGQISLSLICACGLALSTYRIAVPNIKEKELFKSHLKQLIAWGLLNFTLFTLFGFSSAFGLGISFSTPIGLACFASLVFVVLPKEGGSRKTLLPDDPAAILRMLLCILIPLIASALLVNLKRGPWVGILFASFVFFLYYKRKLVFPIVLAAVLIVALIDPVQRRLAQSSRDFFEQGGRSVMWEIGIELSTRFPMGVGFKNSPFLQKFAPEIPPEMRHFHNNLINILVEGGSISLAFYLWWIFSLIRLAFSSPQGEERPLVFSIGCALLSWQIAGLVEYNFGDSEVLCMAYILIGLLLGLTLRQKNAGYERSSIIVSPQTSLSEAL